MLQRSGAGTFFGTSSLLLVLLHVSMVGGSDDCIKKKCRKGVLSPSIENNTLILPPCDECTNCTPSKLQTVQAWWYYKWPNGSRTDDIRATVVNESYEISFLGHPSLVVPGQYHNIYTNYMYLCGEVPGVLRDIRITLQPVAAFIESPNEMPISEGSTVVIQCKTGLQDSRRVKTTFKFADYEKQCPHNTVPVHHDSSTWVVNRTDHEPYTCTLYIEDIKPMDSGNYYCEEKIPYVLNPVISDPLYIEATSNNFNTLILETTIPASAVVLILLVIVVLVVVGCFAVAPRCRIRPEPADAEDPRHPLVQGGAGGRGYDAAVANQLGGASSSSNCHDMDNDSLPGIRQSQEGIV